MNEQKLLEKRETLKKISFAAGLALGYSILPTKWEKPRLEFGLLPAHATCSTDTVCQCCVVQDIQMVQTQNGYTAGLNLNQSSCSEGTDVIVRLTQSGGISVEPTNVSVARIDKVLNATASGNNFILNAADSQDIVTVKALVIKPVNGENQKYTVNMEVMKTIRTLRVLHVSSATCNW